MATMTVTVSTNKVGSDCQATIEIPDEEMEYLTEADFEEMAQEKLWEMINFDYEVE